MVFTYRARTLEGKIVSGSVEAANEREVIDGLAKQGLIIFEITPKKRFLGLEIVLGPGIKARDLAIFSRQLSVMISAGIPLAPALESLYKQTTNRRLKKIIAELTQNVASGLQFSAALAKYPKVFNDFFIAMIRTGETAGKLDKILNYLAEEQERSYEISSKIKGSMVYPIFVVATIFIVGTVMMIFVVPKLTAVIVEAGVELPLTTKILIKVSNFFVHYWWAMLGIIIFSLIFFSIFTRTRIGGYAWDRAKIKLPVFGALFQKISFMRFSRSLSILVAGGVPLLAALKITAGVVGNLHYQNLIEQTIKAVEGGQSIATIFMDSPDIPAMITQMLIIGEQTGKLDEVLDRVSIFYAQEVERTLANLVTLLEPLIIILLGVAVGFLASAVILPMYKMASSF